jgi:hypothetical protein
MSTLETLKARKLEYSLVALAYVAMVIFAYNVPLDVLDRYPAAKSFSDFMASWNPQIDRMGRLTLHANQANRFVYSVLWALSPVAFAYFLFREYVFLKSKNFITVRRDSAEVFLNIIILIFVILFLLFIPYKETRGNMERSGFIQHEWRSLLAPFFVYILIAIKVNLIVCLWQITTHRIEYSGEKKTG